MKHIKKELKRTLELTIFFSVLIFLMVWGLYKPAIIGYVVYEVTEHEKIWDFTNVNDYTYDELINLSNGARLIPNIEIIKVENYSYEDYYISKALYDPDDKTDKVDGLDSKDFEIEDDIFDVIFEEKLDNGNIIHLYIEEGNSNEIFLCDLGNECNSPGYGKVDYDEDEGWYNITVSGLDEAIIGFNIRTDDEVEINYIYATNNEDVDIVKALDDPDKRTYKVDELDNYKQDIHKHKIFNVIFEEKLDNGDVISIYAKLKDDDFDDVYLCDYGIECNSPGYGKVDVNGEEDEYYWFNITISNLNEPTKYFNIDPDLRIDYIYAHRFINNSYNIINITYQSSVIDTKDLTVSDFGNWDLLTKNENLNEQEINYYYSINSGNSWNLISNFNLSYVNSSTISLRANLTSDTISTPELNSLSLKYFTSVACEEDWQLNYGDCRNNDTKLKYYIDVNNCGSFDNLPQDNGTSLICDYCTPNFVCVTYNSCNVDLKQKTCNETADTNYCYDLTGLDSDNIIPNLDEYCTEFISDSAVINDNTSEYNFYYNTDETLNINLNNSELFIDLEINNVINGSISIINYDGNIKNKTVDIGLKYFEINSNIDNINSNTIKIYYTDEEINNNNLDEDTLDIYYYNESNQWQKLNSTLNKTGKYLEVVLDHLSYYGIFGEEKTISSSSNSGGSSGSSGGYILTPQQKKIMVNEEEIKTYEIDSSIENEIDFVDNNKYRFNIKNKGDKIDRIELSLDNNVVRLSQDLIENFDKNNEIELSLITDNVLTRTKSNLLIQGSSVKTVEQKIKDVLVEFTILGVASDNIVVNKTIPLTLKLILFDKVSNKKILPYNIAFIIFMIALKVSLLVIWKVFHKKGKKKKINKKKKRKGFLKIPSNP